MAGTQYCSHPHVALLQKSNAMISITHSGDPLENAIAERVNGILKTELISSSYEDIYVPAGFSQHPSTSIKHLP